MSKRPYEVTITFDADAVDAGAPATGRIRLSSSSQARLGGVRLQGRWVRRFEGGDANTHDRQGEATHAIEAPAELTLPAEIAFQTVSPSGTFSHEGARVCLRHAFEVLAQAREGSAEGSATLTLTPAPLPPPGTLDGVDGPDGLRGRFGGTSATTAAILGLRSQARGEQARGGAAQVGAVVLGAVCFAVAMAIGASVVAGAGDTDSPGMSLILGALCLLTGLTIPAYGAWSLWRWRRRRARIGALVVPWAVALGETTRVVVRGQDLVGGPLRWRLTCQEGALKVVKGKTMREGDHEEWTSRTIIEDEGALPGAAPDGVGGQQVALPLTIPISGPPSLVHKSRTLTWWFEVFDSNDPTIRLRAELLVVPFRAVT